MKRFDVLYGAAMFRPEFCCRISHVPRSPQETAHTIIKGAGRVTRNMGRFVLTCSCGILGGCTIVGLGLLSGRMELLQASVPIAAIVSFAITVAISMCWGYEVEG